MAGQDAELLLKVGLDLTAFKQSLAGLGAASVGYSLPIKIKFDRGTLNTQLANLTAAIGKKKYTVELNIAGGLTGDQLKKIQDRLKTLKETEKVEIPVSVIAQASDKEIKKVVAGLNRSIKYSDALVNGKIRVPATIFSAITKKDVSTFAADAKSKLAGVEAGISVGISDTDISTFKEKIKSKLSGIAVDVTANVKSNFAAGPTGLAGLEEFMRTQGASGGHVSGGAAKGAAEVSRRVLFEKTVSEAPSKDLKRMLQVAEVKGRSRLTTISQMQEALLKLGSEAQEKILGNLKMQMSEPPRKISRSFLDQVARAVFWMAGVDPEYLRQQAAQPKKKQPQKPFGLLPRVTAKGAMEDMMRMLSGGADGGESGKLALSSEQLKARVDAILRDYFRIVEVQVKEVFDAPLQLKKQINRFDYLVQALRDAEQVAKQNKIDATVAKLINTIEEIINKAESKARASAAMSRLGQVSVREISNASFVKPGQLLLPQGETRKMLPGRPSQASILELNNILAGAIEAYFKSVAAGIRRAPIDRTPLLPPGGGGKGRLMLPAAGETTAFNRMRVATGAYVGQPAPMRAPSIEKPAPSRAPSTSLSLDYYKNAFKYQAALQTATDFSKNFTASQLPLIGGLKNAAAEFGQAAKQVLLYGAAYKGLAFISGLPGQILDAAKNQQQYANALKVSTQETGTFAKEMLFVNNVQRAFGLNLETTRSGFVRLYASMAPTGFDSGSIEKLFTGISAATAALQLTPDKAERVIYAFGQMASKGQIMSEELKGQLGDVLPGALSIFAKAAGMSVKEFSKAMEDGEFTGKRFREMFAKVSDELITRFGTGAQVAGKSLQGLINTVGGDFTRTLESFAPLADSAAQATLAPLSRMLKDVGTAAQIAMGEMERVQSQIKDAKQIVVDLKVGGAKPEQIKAAEQNVSALQMRYEQLNAALQDPAMTQRVNDIQKFTTELAKAGTFVINMAGAIGNMLSPVLSILGTNLTTVISLITSFYVGFQTARLAAMALMGALLLYRNLSILLGFGAAANGARALAGVFGLLGIAVNGATLTTVGLRLALTALVSATVVGAVVGGIMLIVGAFASMRDKAKEAGEESRNAAKTAAEAIYTGNVAQAEMQVATIEAKHLADKAALKVVEDLYKRGTTAQRKGSAEVALTDEQSLALQQSKLTAGMIESGRIVQGRRTVRAPSNLEIQDLRQQFNNLSDQRRVDYRETTQALAQSKKRAAQLGLNKPTLGTPGTGADEDKAKAQAEEKQKAESTAKEAETRAKAQDQAANRQQQLAIDAANRQVALDQSSFDSRLRMSDAEYDHKKALQDTYFEREMSGLDSIEARQKKFQQDLQAIEDRRIDTIRKAEIDATKAVQEFRVANIKAEAASGGVVPTGPSKYVDRSILRKYLESEGFGRTSGDFTDKGHATYRHTINAMDYGILGGSDADALRKTIAMERKMRATGAFGDQLYGPERDPYGHGAGKGGGNIHLHLPTPDQKVLLTPKLANLFAEKGLLGGAASSSARPGAFAMGRREDKAGGQLAVEQQGVEIKALERLETIRRANKLAIEETITTIRRNIDTIFPVKEQQLENDLLELRNKLELKGMSRESIDMEVQKTKATKESARLLQALNEAIAKNDEALAKLKDKKIATPEDVKQMNLLTEQTAEYKLGIADTTEQQRLFNEQLARTAELTAAQKTPQAIIASTAASLRTQFEEMTNLGTVATNVASTISGAFSTAFQGVVSGSMTAQQALSSFFKSVADAFLDMAAKMIAKWIEMQIIGLAQSLLGAGLGAGLGALGGGAGGGFSLGGAGSGTGGAVGSLGGAMSPTTSLPSFSSSFGSFSGGGFGVAGFAEGGIPPIGVPSLVGEQGPELFVPRTAGTVIPADTTAAAMARYQRQGSSSAPSAMEGIPAAAQGIPILSMSFETTQFMGQDWVSKDQLVAAMAATEKRATAAGAKAGAQQVATKMRTSPAFRRQVGV